MVQLLRNLEILLDNLWKEESITATVGLSQLITDLSAVVAAILGQFTDIVTFMVTNPFILIALGVIFFGAITKKLRNLIG